MDRLKTMKKLLTFSKAEDPKAFSSFVFLLEELRETDRELYLFNKAVTDLNNFRVDGEYLLSIIDNVIDGYLDCMFVCLSGLRKYSYSKPEGLLTEYNYLFTMQNKPKTIDDCFEVILSKENMHEKFTQGLDNCFHALYNFLASSQIAITDVHNFIDKAFDRVCDANLAKLDPETNEFIKNESGKIIKPDGWQPPQYRDLLLEHGF